MYMMHLLNENKTEMILFRQKFRCDFSWWPDSEVQVERVVQSCFLQLRKLLSHADFEKVFLAFVLSRQDHCNSLYTGLSQKLISCLQLVQNAAASISTGNKRRGQITQS